MLNGFYTSNGIHIIQEIDKNLMNETDIYSLFLTNEQIDYKNVSELCDVLKNKSCSLTSLDLVDDRKKNRYLLSIFEALNYNLSVNCLSLSGFYFYEDDLIKLSETFMNNNIETLNLNYCSNFKNCNLLFETL